MCEWQEGPLSSHILLRVVFYPTLCFPSSIGLAVSDALSTLSQVSQDKMLEAKRRIGKHFTSAELEPHSRTNNPLPMPDRPPRQTLGARLHPPRRRTELRLSRDDL